MPGAVTPTPDEVAWMLSRPRDSLVPNIIACAAIAFTAVTVFVGLRLWSRRIIRGRLRLDVSDWLVVAAWVFYIPFTAILILITRYGAGRHVVFVMNARLLGIFTIVDENLYATVLLLLKLSILSLYRELFASSRRFYWCTWAVTALVAEWFIQVVLATSLQCVPIAASWDPSVHGSCINYGIEALVAYLINISSDLMILSMPIPLVLRLNTSKAQKRRLIISFIAGGSACIVSLVQLAYITKLGNAPDASYAIVPSELLGDVEIMIGFLATSVATYRPLYRFIFQDHSSNRSGTSAGNEPTPYDGTYERNRFGRKVSVGTGNLSGGTLNSSRHGITVTDRIELTRHENARGAWVRVHDEPEPFTSS